MTTTPPFHPQIQPLSHEDIVRLVGDLQDATIVAIEATGATYAEIEQALKWTGGGREEPRLNAEAMTPRAELVCDILLADQGYVEAERD